MLRLKPVDDYMYKVGRKRKHRAPVWCDVTQPAADVLQGTPEWHALRKGCKVTASSAAELMGIGYKKLAWVSAFWRYASGMSNTPPPEEERSDFARARMKVGVDWEPHAREVLELWSGNAITEVGFFTRWLPALDMRVGASPDGVMWLDQVGGHACVEIKCTDMNLRTSPKPSYIVQMYWQMYCTGLRACVFAQFHITQGMLVWLVHWDEDVWNFMLERVEDFIDRHGKGKDGGVCRKNGWWGSERTCAELEKLSVGSIHTITGVVPFKMPKDPTNKP